jgi:3-hydroxyisobutyrate dehydrogenase-like beta-hydroxyacid dehydrogenase
MRIGFIGVGTMGEPMAASLLKAGHSVAVLAHRNRAPVERLLAQGASETTAAAALAAQVELLFTCLPNDAAVEQVLTGPEGVLAGAERPAGQPSLVIVDCSTIAPATSQRLAEQARARGAELLDAPISGGQAGALAGTLAVMVGGSPAAYQRALPALQAVGRSITHVGPNGAALAVKLGNNLVVAAELVAIAEALALAKASGVDTAVAQRIMAASTARSYILNERVPGTMLTGNLAPAFRLELLRKDLGLALEHGMALGVPMFATAEVHQLYTQAQGLGKGALDSTAIVQLYEEALGQSLATAADADDADQPDA